MANYLELRKVVAGVGSPIGLAAAKIGWEVLSDASFSSMAEKITHIDASFDNAKRSFLLKQIARAGYHYRLNRLRLRACRDIGFYYR